MFNPDDWDPAEWDSEDLKVIRDITKDALKIVSFVFVFGVFLASCTCCALVFVLAAR